MSHYTECKTAFKSKEALIKALIERGWTKDKIEVHDQAVKLVGYRGDERATKANIVIRRVHVGAASNDIGFRREENGTYTAVVSDYDRHKYGGAWMKQLKQSYTKNVSIMKLKGMGCMVTEHKNKEGQAVIIGFLPG